MTFDGAPVGLEKNLIRASWDPKGEKIAAGSGDRSVVVWDSKSGKLLYKLPGHKGTVNDVPKRYRALDGKRVLLKGFMYPLTSAGPKGAEFQFVYNINKCCFSGPPQVQERVFAHGAKGRAVPLYRDVLVELYGTLHVRVIREGEGADAAILSVYDIDVESAKPVSG